ncbi:MAG: hypothetical protein CMF62_00110 [Magnetococcales bacterium]|nr:hypothetical protein [Magnetococcales bacterium]
MEYELSPEKIAENNFTKKPKEPCTGLLIAEKVGNDASYLFEIMINVMLEGMEILSGGLDKAKFEEFNEEFILFLNPWFQSLGIELKVTTFDKSEKELWDNYYCKIIINNSEWNNFFVLKKIQKNFHFLINPKYYNGTNEMELKNHTSIFMVNNKVYQIYFDIHKS